MPKANGKRILSVTVRRMNDESPDTSWLGEYSSRPESEYAIDRAHREDCESLKPDFKAEDEWSYWNGSAEQILNRVRMFLENFETEEDHWSSPNGCHEDCPACAESEFEREATQTVWELEKNAGECDCSFSGHWNNREYRYFNPNYKNYAGLPEDEIRKYCRQDFDRMESLDRGDWCFIGLRAEAEVQTGSDVVQRIVSGGLWGIESDSGREHLEETQREELAQLKDELLGLGFSRRAIATAFKNVREKGD